MTIDIPGELRRPHPLVTATRQAASGLKAREDGRLEIGPRPGVAFMRVSRNELRRALLVLQGIAAHREAERRQQEEERLEREQRARIGRARVERLQSGIALSRLAADTREYVAALRALLPELEPAERERIAAWCTWAGEWASANDPAANPQRTRRLDDERDGFHNPFP